MGIENLRFEMRELSEHDKYKELIQYFNDYQNKFQF